MSSLHSGAHNPQQIHTVIQETPLEHLKSPHMPGDSSWAPPLFARPFRPHPLDTWATESEATQTSSPIIPSHIQRKADEEHEGIDDERESENGEEPQVTKAEDAPETAEGDNKWIPKVNKKSTVDQLREALEQMGLNTKGKKETLLRCVVDDTR